MKYRNLTVGFVVTLLVAGANAAGESTTKAAAQSGTTDQAVVPPAAKPPTAPATQASTQGPTATKPPPSTTGKSGKAPAKPEKKVDLNNATLAELRTLPTVGDAEAKKIIAHRPYNSKGELVTKAGLPEGVYLAVRYKVQLQKPRTPAPKK